jgi:hypothetical protein
MLGDVATVADHAFDRNLAPTVYALTGKAIGDRILQTPVRLLHPTSTHAGNSAAFKMPDGVVRPWVIEFHPRVYHREYYGLAERQEILLHEVGHLIAFCLHGIKGEGHCPAWEQAVRDLGGTPAVYHELEGIAKPILVC